MEKELLINVLRHDGILECARVGVKGSDFQDDFYRSIYKAACMVYNSGKAVNYQSVISEMLKDGPLSDGNRVKLRELSSAHTDISALDAAQDLRERAERWALAGELRGAYEELISGAEIDAVTRKVRDTLGETVGHSSGTITAKDAIEESLEYARLKGVPTGFPALDRCLHGGFKPTKFYVLAARPGVGKSLMMGQIAYQAAQAGNKVLILTLEMGPGEITRRLISHLAHIPHEKLISDTERQMDTAKGKAARRMIAESGLSLNPGNDRNIDSIMRIMRREAANGVKLIFVDYMQLITIKNDRSNRATQLAQITAGIKSFARSANVAVCGIAMIKRPTAGARPGPPQLHEIKDSGTFEQDADFVGVLHRDEEPGPDPQFIDLYIRKWRQGRLGKIAYEANLNFQTLTEIG